MAEEVRITQRPVHGWPFTPPTGTITSASSCFTTWASKTEALDIRRCSQLWGVPGVGAPTHLRMRAMVSFLSFPWNGSDPVSISNCKGTQDGERVFRWAGHSHTQPQEGNATPSPPGQWGAGPATCTVSIREHNCLVEATVQGRGGQAIKAANKPTLWWVRRC